MEKSNVIYGELGEAIKVSGATIQKEGEHIQEITLLSIDGVKPEKDGIINVCLSTSASVELCKCIADCLLT